MISINMCIEKLLSVLMILLLGVGLNGQSQSDSVAVEYQLNGEMIEITGDEILLPSYKGFKEIRVVKEGAVPLTVISTMKKENSIESLFKDSKEIEFPQLSSDGQFSLYLRDLKFAEDGKLRFFQASAKDYSDDPSASSWKLEKERSLYRSNSRSAYWSEASWNEAFDFVIYRSHLGRDTTRSSLDFRYRKDFFLEAEVTQYSNYSVGSNFQAANERWLLGIEVKVKWILTDIYGQEIAEHETASPLIFYRKGLTEHPAPPPQLGDAISYCLVDLLKEKAFSEAIAAAQSSDNESLTKISIAKSKTSASNLSEASKACLTVTHDGKGHSSGFVISDDGYFLTTYSSVYDKENIKVILSDGSSHPAELLRQNKEANLALMKFEGKDCYNLQLESLSPDSMIGTVIYAIGTPSASDLGQSMSKGIVSGLRKVHKTKKLLQTDVRISPGYRGGALVTKDGKCIGMVAGKIIAFGVEGVAFGHLLQDAVEELNITFE